MAKKQYYSIENLLNTEADYMLLLGERANGKSYQAKYTCLWEAYNKADYQKYLETKKIVPKDRYQFGYLRRFDLDIKTNPVIDYFADMGKAIEEITKNEYDCVDCYQSHIYFAKHNGERIERGIEIGRPFSLTAAQHYKSRMFPTIGNVLMEEVIPDDGLYIPNEPRLLFSIVSTIARRDKVRVLMVGNTMNRVCPYFSEWGLRPVLKQKIGTIDIYNQKTEDLDEQGNQVVIKIAVEKCENTSQVNQMFFGRASKSIVNGEWYTDVYPHLDKDLDEYNDHYSILYASGDFAFMIKLLTDDRDKFLFIYPYTGDWTKVIRRVTDEPSLSKFVTPYLVPVTKYDDLVIELLKMKKIRFSDNLTGTDFYNTIKERGKI